MYTIRVYKHYMCIYIYLSIYEEFGSLQSTPSPLLAGPRPATGANGRRRLGVASLGNPSFPLKDSFKGDVGPYKACIGLYWQKTWAQGN